MRDAIARRLADYLRGPRAPAEQAETRRDVVALLDGYSVETTPISDAQIGEFADHLPEGTPVYIGWPPSKSALDVAETARRLAGRGLDPVPHVAARRLSGEAELEDFLERVTLQAGVREVLVIGGSPGRSGPYTSALEVLETGSLQRYGIRRVGVAAYPEGHPDISEAALAEALAEKRAYAERAGLELTVVAQFCFDPDTIVAWLQRLAAEHPGLPVRIGVPGLASITTLIRFARICGIGPSVRYLTRGAGYLVKLATVWTPDYLLTELAGHKARDPACAIRGVHFYTFGGQRETAEWVAALGTGDLVVDGDGRGFTVPGDTP